MRKTGKQIIDGMASAVDYARTRNAVLDWIKEDMPPAGKMNITPKHVDQLVDRICGTKPTVVGVKQ